MGLFKEVKKPVIKTAVAGGGEISPLRPLFAAKAAPCASGCPNGNQIREVLAIIAQAEGYGLSTEQAFERAWNRIVELNPFPAITGRVCPHPCEGACNREAKDGAVAFHEIERTLGDFGLARNLQLPRINSDQRHERIAVVGAGPAGLSCAYQLERRGYSVTIFEGFPLAGGLLRYGIPESRLRHDVLDAEINRVLALGIELRSNCRIGGDISLEQIQNEYDAVFVGTGAWQTVPLNVPGESACNVVGAVDFLRRWNGGEKIEVGTKVVIVGAGPTAIDVAHVGRKLGAFVTMVAAEVTATPEEIAALRNEGVQVEAPAVVETIHTADGRAKVVRCANPSAVADEARDGAASSKCSSHFKFDLDTSFVILATDRRPDLQGFAAVANGSGWFHADDWGRVADGLFAGGDNTGLSTVTRAIAQGRLAAAAMHRQLQGLEPEIAAPLPIITASKMRLDWYQPAPRTHDSHSNAIHEAELDEEQVMTEAKRCMSCGMCMDCETCWMYCTNNCFVRLPKGEHSRIKLEVCNGCKKCAEACPTGYIEMA